MALLSALFGKNANYLSEYKRFKKAMKRTPGDHGLKAQFIKFCLLNRFTKHETIESHMAEALKLFESIENTDNFDLQCNYLVGKYYQEARDNRKAYQIYLNAIKRFNRYVGQNPQHKSENSDQAYSIALNLMNLQANPVDPELEICFKHIRRSYPLHVKRIELENEMAKPAPDKARIKQLSEEVRRLKTEEDKETAAATKEEPTPAKAPEPSVPKREEKKDIFSKLLSVPPLDPKKLGGPETDGKKPFLMSEEWEKKDSLKLSVEAPPAAFMAYHNDSWVGPYTPAQLRSMGFLKRDTWVCRAGSEQVMQAYEAADLQAILQH